ncbi:C48 family peptidase [Bradyrhizobium sp. C-145]|uniref:Ulp1 family isopeptidase n=1 Tax=Bradyrhizobium sp. C-145 TaxID=574727 RepID=UPI00201B7D3F|nr:Ulp1 family isopeptidase [Bradyrhizobium sp. C-145]UQR61281.1 C48 family peptidase [Bradyrhizobium sp. C-145]
MIPSQSDRVQTFRKIVNDQDGNDTTNLLFVPVNDGGVSGGGARWSLLLVDRRVPTAPVAYHYDSVGSRNSTVAEQLAARLGSRLQPARMARQQNGHDCGVYVVDATRALIGRLAQGERPDKEPLHLEHLIADRPAQRLYYGLYSCGRVIRFAFRRSNPQSPLTFR